MTTRLGIDRYLIKHGVDVGPDSPLYAPLEPDEAGDPPGRQAGQGGPAAGQGDRVRGDTPYLDLDGEQRFGLDYRRPPRPEPEGNAIFALVYIVAFAACLGLLWFIGWAGVQIWEKMRP